MVYLPLKIFKTVRVVVKRIQEIKLKETTTERKDFNILLDLDFSILVSTVTCVPAAAGARTLVH